ncbi:MAG: AMP-binding protein [Gammaproteobacteria bacterium]|nr:AMP-binding protein [Gammaproteobacteria bacterium]
MDKLWLEQYPDGIPHTIDINTYPSLTALFDDVCHQHKERTAYINFGHKLTYAKLEALSRTFSAYLQSLNLTQGARVAIMLPNVLQYPVALFAILRAGYVVVNTNPLYTADEISHQINDSRAEAIIVLANFASTVEKALPNMPKLNHVIVTEVGDVLSSVKRVAINTALKHFKKQVPPYHIKKAVTWRKAIARGKKKPFSSPPLGHENLAFIQYTGGTTGVSKGAMLTHGNLIANVMQAFAWITPIGISQEDIIVTALPLYHIFSLTANCLTFFKAGATNILITNPRDISGFIKTIKHAQFTAITGVNTLFNALINHPKFTGIDFSKLRLALSGGMALQKSVAEAWCDKTNMHILEAYGLTETSPAVTINPLTLKTYNGSIGLPLPSTDIAIRDENGNNLALGESGELCIKGPQVMPGYWQRADETSLVFWPDGFLRTGDVAKLNKQGFVYLVDRKKDMILVSGFNVYPNEVEQIIGLMPQVLEVGVVGVEDNSGGEVVKACIVKRDPSLTEEQVIAHCRQHLTAYKVPKILAFYDDLPKTNVGKVLRRELK